MPDRRRRLPFLLLPLLALALALAAGCEEAREAELLELRSAGPAQIDPGHPLVIEGGPFAIHHEVSVRLVGELARPFEAPESITRELTAHAASESRIEVPLDPRMLRDEIRRATFRGRVEVREAAQWGELPGAVLGMREGVVIDFVPPRSIDSPARALDRMLGVTFALESEHGLALASVEPEGIGALLGLEPGDVLEGEGHAIFVPGDTPLVAEGVTDASLIVARDGEGERSLAWRIEARRDDEGTADRTRLLELAVLLVWLALLRTLPLRSIEHGTQRPAAALTRPTAAFLARAALTLVVAHVVLRAVSGGMLPALPLLVSSLAGVRAALVYADARGSVRALPAALVTGLGLAAGLALLPIARGSADLAVLSHGGAPSPLAWPLFTEPVGPLALGLVGAGLASARPATRRASSAIDDLVVVAVAALVVVEGTGLSPTGRTGMVAMTVLVALVAWLLGHVRGRLAPLAASIATASLGALAAIALGAWTLADPSPLVRHAATETVLAMTLVLAVLVARRALAPRVPARTAHALL
ncbi:MAG: hypothetical protein U0234_08920 [Sandaracinus sp.]